MMWLKREQYKSIKHDTYYLYSGVDALFHKIKGVVKHHKFHIKDATKRAEKIYDISVNLVLNDEQLRSKLKKFQQQIKLNKHYLNSDVDDMLAHICEASFRTLHIRPYPVQILGAIALLDNRLIEMKPGEGKTITAAIAAVMKGWSAKPCHIVTSNEYLVGRDAKLMQPLYQFCNLQAGYVVSQMSNDERRKNYNMPIVYSTSKELLADFLRDMMLEEELSDTNIGIINILNEKKSPKMSVMRGLYSAIIDEADSVLADEAITPLIISLEGQNNILKDATKVAFEISQKIVPNIDYILKSNDIFFTHQGEEKVESLTQEHHGIWNSYSWSDYLIKQAIAAREFYHKDVHYVIVDGKIIIIDEKTGRMMHGRNWGGGLHQAIEMKEGLELSDPTHTHTKMSFQRFFRLYSSLSGMSGTLHNLKGEMWSIYKLLTVVIPTHKVSKMVVKRDKIFVSKEEKNQNVIDEIIKVAKSKRPILVGTRTIQESEILANELMIKGITCTVLNALHHEEESEIIAIAGEIGKITIATNMAGRGTDIMLKDETQKLGGLHVIATQRHTTKRVDLQLFGRCARQGQEGSVQPMLSLEDELIRKYLPSSITKVLQKHLDSIIVQELSLFLYKSLQLASEFLAAKQRKMMLRQDFTISKALSFTGKGRF